MNLSLSPTTSSRVRPAGVYPFALGAFSCLVVSDEGRYTLPLLPTVSKHVPLEELTALLHAHALSTTQIPLQISVLFVNTGKHQVLIDTGLGGLPGPSGVVESIGKVRQNLDMAGVKPEAIDTILLSHMHSDHIGGLLDAQGHLTFPNARYALTRAEWEFWTRSQPDLSSLPLPEPAKQRLVQLVQGTFSRLEARLTLVEAGQEIIPGVCALATPTETPGHSSFLLSSQGETLLVIGDALPHHIIGPQHPEWTTVFDRDSEQVEQIRRSLLARAAHEAWLVLGYHFPWPSLGHIVRRDASFAWAPIEYRWNDHQPEERLL